MARWKLSQFDFELPQELLAEYPTEDRDESRLMVVHKDTGEVEHKKFIDILDYFEDGGELMDDEMFEDGGYFDDYEDGGELDEDFD